MATAQTTALPRRIKTGINYKSTKHENSVATSHFIEQKRNNNNTNKKEIGRWKDPHDSSGLRPIRHPALSIHSNCINQLVAAALDVDISCPIIDACSCEWIFDSPVMNRVVFATATAGYAVSI